MGRCITKTHDKYKEMVKTWGLNKNCAVSTIQMPIEDLIDIVDEFERLKRLKEYYDTRGTYGIRDNY